MKIGIIGGSGLDNPKILKDYEETNILTEYGWPSSPIIKGKMAGIEVFIIARHGRKHEIPPTQVNNKANIDALKKFGCTHIIASTAVGSLREEIKRGDFIILDQFIDFTKRREVSFFESFKDGAKHTPMAEPFSRKLRRIIEEVAQEMGIPYHKEGTVITIEGPRFSTKAESKMFRIWGADVVNMSIAPEAILAKEAGIEYAAIAMSTDYDSWKEGEEQVSWKAILDIFEKNAEKMKTLLVKTIEKIADNDCSNIKQKIRTVPNWPKPGIMFRDITTLLQDAEAFEKVIEKLEKRYSNKEIDLIAGIESRGFVIAAALASKLKKGLILVRKPGKLPYTTIRADYELEYGKNSVEIHADAVKPGQKVLLVDDLIATGGTCAAAGSLIEQLGGEVVECAFVVELPELKGREKVKWPIFKVVDFEGE